MQRAKHSVVIHCGDALCCIFDWGHVQELSATRNDADEGLGGRGKNQSLGMLEKLGETCGLGSVCGCSWDLQPLSKERQTESIRESREQAMLSGFSRHFLFHWIMFTVQMWLSAALCPAKPLYLTLLRCCISPGCNSLSCPAAPEPVLFHPIPHCKHPTHSITASLLCPCGPSSHLPAALIPVLLQKAHGPKDLLLLSAGRREGENHLSAGWIVAAVGSHQGCRMGRRSCGGRGWGRSRE